MRYFKLKPSIHCNVGVLSTKVRIPYSIDNNEFISNGNTIVHNRFLSDSKKILLELTNDEGLDLKFKNVHRWETNNPNAAILVMNELLKDLLRKFKIQEHKYYSISIISEGLSKSYYLLHVLNKTCNNIDYKNSRFILSNYVENTVIKEYDRGEIKSLEEITIINKNEAKNFSGLKLIEAVYDSQFDVFGGSGNDILINEKVCNELLDHDLDGLSLEEFAEFEIVMPTPTSPRL